MVSLEAPFLSRRWPKPLLVVIAPINGGMTRLSGPAWPG